MTHPKRPKAATGQKPDRHATPLTVTSHITAMIRMVPHFEPKMLKSGHWFVSVVTGNGPDSHIGDFATEADAKNWILNKSRYWPSKPDAPK
jgi:hypothetical protein